MHLLDLIAKRFFVNYAVLVLPRSYDTSSWYQHLLHLKMIGRRSYCMTEPTIWLTTLRLKEMTHQTPRGVQSYCHPHWWHDGEENSSLWTPYLHLWLMTYILNFHILTWNYVTFQGICYYCWICALKPRIISVLLLRIPQEARLNVLEEFQQWIYLECLDSYCFYMKTHSRASSSGERCLYLPTSSKAQNFSNCCWTWIVQIDILMI